MTSSLRPVPASSLSAPPAPRDHPHVQPLPDAQPRCHEQQPQHHWQVSRRSQSVGGRVRLSHRPPPPPPAAAADPHSPRGVRAHLMLLAQKHPATRHRSQLPRSETLLSLPALRPCLPPAALPHSRDRRSHWLWRAHCCQHRQHHPPAPLAAALPPRSPAPDHKPSAKKTKNEVSDSLRSHSTTRGPAVALRGGGT